MNDQDKVNILLVDDQPGKLLSYEVILAELGENLIAANSGREALEVLLKNDVAVVLVDVSMPELDGFELAAMIREHPRFERTAIIFVSAIHMSEFDRLRGYEVGAVDYIPVPVVPGLLRAKVRVFADLYRKTRQLEQLNGELELRVAERTAELEQANSDLERRVEERTREREAAFAQITEMQKLESLGQITGGVAHDFNNLLMVLMGNLGLIRKRLPPDPAMRRMLDNAFQAAERGATLTKRMLAFARRQELRPEAVDLAKLVDGMEDMMRQSLNPSVQIASDVPAGLPPARVDRNQLELALLNLALNARDAMPHGGELCIMAREVRSPDKSLGLSSGRYVRLSVRDSGTGMDEETLKRASEPFFTTKGAGSGSGLGLSMVHGLAAQSGGIMRIDSRLGSGTTVELLLPVANEAARGAELVAKTADWMASGCRILLVDDDALILMTTTAILEDLGHLAVEASSGAQALEALRAGLTVDLVITDHAMPGMTGAMLARQIRKEWPRLPIILATGYADLPPGEASELPRLAKPYSSDELARQIAEQTAAQGASNVISLDAALRA